MIRILYVTDSLLAGGTEQQLVALIGALDRRQYQPLVVCLYGEQAGRSLHFLPALQRLDVPVLVLDKTRKISMLFALIACIWRLRPNLIQMVNYHSNLLVRLARPLLPLRVRLIGRIYVEYTRKQLLYEWLSGWLCWAIVTNSPQIVRRLRSGAGRRRVRLIPNGIDLARFAETPDLNLRATYAPGARCIFLFVGRIARQKAVHLMVDALALLRQRGQLPDGVFLWLVGERSEPAADELLEAAIRRGQLAAVVRRCPVTQHPEDYYHAADALVLVSLREGLPNVILESFAAGRPVIVSEAANGAEIVRNGVNGWVVLTGDVEQLAAVFHRVIVQPAMLASLRPACREAALPYSVEHMAAAYTELYAELQARE